jgi:hypothetical protein
MIFIRIKETYLMNPGLRKGLMSAVPVCFISSVTFERTGQFPVNMG